jgi:threonine dehydratase
VTGPGASGSAVPHRAAPGLITLSDVIAARWRITGVARKTPVVSATSLGRDYGVRLYVKAELFQTTGSFKIRGCLNRLAQLSERERERGLLSMSSGNHAAALARAAAHHGLRATIVMPANASPTKIRATESYGGEALLTEGSLTDAMAAVQAERRMTLIHPFDDPAIIAGAGTVGLEVAEEIEAFDTIIVPVGGGGLISGVAAAIKQARPTVRVVGVEPAEADGMTRSLAAGKPVDRIAGPTIADGLAPPVTGQHTFAHVQAFVDQLVTVGENAIAAATRSMMERTKLYVEPSAAAPLAALQTGAVRFSADETVVLVASGGNVDPGVFPRLSARG